MTDVALTKRLYIKTYGCQMNVYDSERMADVLRPLGYGLVDQAEGADLVVLNTCHIREKATEKVYSELGKLVIGLRADDDVDGGLAANDLLALSLGDAAGHRDGHGRAIGRPGQLHVLDPAQF